MNSIGLAGAHRVGKSTLAKAVAEKLGWSFLPSRATEVFAAHGFQVGERLTFDQRLKVQTSILEAHIADAAAMKGSWISDRTTLDLATYTLMAGMDTESLQKETMAYVNRCLHEVNRLYGMVVLVQPGIAPVMEEGKFPPNPVTQELMNSSLWGLMANEAISINTMFLRRETIDLTERVDSVLELNQILARAASVERQGAIVH